MWKSGIFTIEAGNLVVELDEWNYCSVSINTANATLSVVLNGVEGAPASVSLQLQISCVT